MKKFLIKKWHEYRAHKELQKIISNINWLFLDQGIRMGLGFFVSIWVIRYLGPERYGVLSYATAMVMFFVVFSKLGLDAIVVRELVDARHKREKVIGTVFFMKLIGGTVAVIGATLLAYALKADAMIAVITLLISFSLIFQATDVIDFWFQSRVASKYVAIARSSAVIVSAFIKLFLVYVSASLVWFAAIAAIEAFMIAVGFIIAYVSTGDHPKKWIADMRVAKDLMRDAWPLILSAVSVMIYMRIDQVMIGNMLGYDALGQYSVAVNLSEMWYFIPVIIANSVFPAIIITRKRSKKEYYARLQKLYDMMVWLAVGIALPMTFLSGWIVETLYGVEYAQAGSVLAIYIWAGIFVFLNCASWKWYIAEDLQFFPSIFAVFGAIVNVALNYLLIPKIGISGAAWATLMSYFLSMYIFSGVSFKTRGNFIRMSWSLIFMKVFRK